MMALFQRIFGHAEAQRDGGAEMDGFLARRRGGAEDFGTKGQKEVKVEATMSNHQTAKLPNHQTIFARWAAGVEGAVAGTLPGSARAAEVA